jgi:hypothetical protein
VRADFRTFRAILIAIVLAFGFVAAWPARIPKMVETWPPSLAALALGVGPVQHAILAPFAPVAELLDINSEDWALFGGTGGTRYRMWVEARAGHRGYTLLYRAHDERHAYLAGALRYRRVLNIWNPHRNYISRGYPAYVHWLGARIRRDFPRFHAVRVRMEEVTIRRGGEGFEPSGRFVYEETVGGDTER